MVSIDTAPPSAAIETPLLDASPLTDHVLQSDHVVVGKHALQLRSCWMNTYSHADNACVDTALRPQHSRIYHVTSCTQTRKSGNRPHDPEQVTHPKCCCLYGFAHTTCGTPPMSCMPRKAHRISDVMHLQPRRVTPHAGAGFNRRNRVDLRRNAATPALQPPCRRTNPIQILS